jgi:hypothetical protein
MGGSERERERERERDRVIERDKIMDVYTPEHNGV